MKASKWTLPGIALAMAWSAVAVQAGPIEDARAQLAAGKADAVDAVLAQTLATRPAPRDALLLSFEAALAAGRTYTAERRALAILDAKDPPPAPFLYQAARVAGLLGKTSLRRDRLVYFLQLEPGATPEVRTALATLCREGADATYFARYARQFGTDEDAFLLGLDQLRRLRDDGKTADYLKLLEAMLKQWNTPREADRLFREMHDARNANVFGLDPAALSDLRTRHKVHNMALLQMWSQGGGSWSVPQTLRMQETQAPELLPPRILGNAFNLGAIPEPERPAHARRLLALAPRLRADANPWYARTLLETVSGNPDLFLKGDKPLLDAAGALELVRHVLSKNNPSDGQRNTLRQIWIRVAWDDAQRQALVAEFPEAIHADTLRELYAASIAEKKDGARLKELVRRTGNRLDVRWSFFGTAAQIGDKEFVRSAFLAFLCDNPWDFNVQVVRSMADANTWTVTERIAIIEEGFRLTGYTPAWKRVVEERNMPLRNEAEWKAFAARVKPEVKSSNALILALNDLSGRSKPRDNSVPPEVHATARRAMDAFEGTWPNPARPDLNGAFGQLLNRYRDLVRNNSDGCRELVAVVLPKLGKGANWWTVAEVARWSNNSDTLFAVAKARTAVEKDFADWLADIQEPKDSTEAIYNKYYPAMGPEVAGEYVVRNQDRWTPAVTARELAAVLKQFPIDAFSDGLQYNLMEAVRKASTVPASVPVLPLEDLAVQVLDRWQGTGAVKERLLQSAFEAGKLEPFLNRYLAATRRLPPATRQRAVMGTLHWTNGRNGNDSPLTQLSDPAAEPAAPLGVLGLTSGEWTATLNAVPAPCLAAVSERHLRHLDWLRGTLAKTLDEPTAKRLDAAEERAMLAIAEGATVWGDSSRCASTAVRALRSAVARKDRPAVARLGMAAARCFERNRANEYLAALDEMAKAELWESVYALADQIDVQDAGTLAALTRLRAEAASRMPGIYPVSENDPAYPLFVAADEFQRRNSERAWALLRANIPVFERDPLRYPPQFVAWAIEQFRLVRGDRDSLQVKSKKLIDTLLSKEQSLPAELAASLMLTRAEIARDRRQFDAARVEYQAIRNHPAYQKTPAGRQAMFRDVDLMVSMGNAAGAEQTVEQWMSVPEPEVQAQAHFVLARIAFDRQDFEETRRQLDQVFAIDFTHTEARLLHGKWKLATNYEVDDTQVLVGDLADRTLIRPGQPLTITVQDRNLGVAGGGATIPILLTTSSGKDRESLALYPSTRDPFLFRGTIETELAAAAPGNHKLEVRGDDLVSYTVDAEFLQARGLTDSGAKVLKVIDDAVMAVGAAVPDAEEGRPEAELERELSGGAAEGERMLTRNLRPGSPIHVAVRDRDRSLTEGMDTVKVSVTTSSGDSLGQVALTETAPYSGVFRSAIPTRLPPPRAAASDSAAGVNPGDTINRTRNGLWRSLPDGKKGKWLDIDTMGSHLVASAALQMPKSGDVALLRLYGRLADEERLLGSFPADKPEQRGGVRVQSARARMRNATDIRRYFLSSDRESKPLTDWSVNVEGWNDDQRFLMRGAICLPAHQRIRLRFVPQTQSNNALRDTWVQLVLDGRTVFVGSNQTLRQQVVEMDVNDGPHLFEVFAAGRGRDDAFRLAMEQADGTQAPIPPEWSNPATNPELAEFLSDKATLERTADGFVATFATPLRLRALRWEFTDFAGSEVSVQSARILDAEGKEVIPVDSDFSDALHNDTLEVAPGDQILVTYLDEETTRGEKRVLERPLTSSFHDAEVEFLFEELVQQPGQNRTEQRLHQAYRLKVGDSLILRVTDPDMDVTPGEDPVTLRVSARDGRQVSLTLREQKNRTTDEWAGGAFLALLRTVDANDPAAVTAAATAKDTLPVLPGETLTATFFDRENTLPGIPVEREAKVLVSEPTTPVLQLYHTWRERAVDTRDEAKVRLAQIRRRPGNEAIEAVLRDIQWATPMDPPEMAGDAPIPVNSAVPVLLAIDDASRARHAASTLKVEAVSGRELQAAQAEGREPATVQVTLRLDGGFGSIRTQARHEEKVARVIDVERFTGILPLRLGSEPSAEANEDTPELPVSGSDTIRLRLLDEQGQPQLERILKLVSGARIELMDSTYSAERKAVHLGERFQVALDDPDRDATDGQDTVEVEVTAEKGGHKRSLTLTETLPHSGLFTGTLRPIFFANGAIPAELGDQIPVAYGDTVLFRYNDEVTLPLLQPGPVETRGTVYQGADGTARVFSKRFRDSDQAVLVQFRLAECLFETAKEFRRLKQPDKSTQAIAEGREILEAALRDYPGTAHAVQGEYLLANLYQELAAEQKQEGNAEAARPLYQEALARFSAILATWPESEYAAQAQYHKALCLEMLEDYVRASEEYVKMTYIFPESPLVGDASIRLATYYYSQEKRYDTAGRIYANFQRRFPAHPRAARALFMGAQCHIKQAETLWGAKFGQGVPSVLVADEYRAAITALTTLVDTYKDPAEKELRAQALYWAGDASFRIGDYPNAYLFLKRTVFEYPETEWARRARGMLVQESKSFETLE